MKSRLAFATFLGLLVAPALAASPPETKALDQLIQHEVTLRPAASVSVAIVRNGRIYYLGAAGDSDRELRRRATPATPYNLASVTKSFTAEAILQLVAARMLSLNDTLANYRPDLGHAREVTIRQLLEQTSCLPDIGSSEATTQALNADVTGEQALRVALAEPLWCTPGRHFIYSNTNYMLLGKVIERASGLSLESYFRVHLTRPAGIAGVQFGSSPNAAKPYILSRKRGIVPIAPIAYGAEGGAGGLFMSASDVARFDIAAMQGRYLPKSLQQQAWKAEIFPDHTRGRYGMGWFAGVDDENGVFSPTLGNAPVVEHTGHNPGYNARNAIFPESGIAIVILANSASYDTFPIFKKIAAQFVPEAAVHGNPAPLEKERPRDSAFIREVFAQLVEGTLPRARLSPRYWGGYTPEFQKQLAHDLAADGVVKEFRFTHAETNGDERILNYDIVTQRETVQLHAAYDTRDTITQIDIH